MWVGDWLFWIDTLWQLNPRSRISALSLMHEISLMHETTGELKSELQIFSSTAAPTRGGDESWEELHKQDMEGDEDGLGKSHCARCSLNHGYLLSLGSQMTTVHVDNDAVKF